MKPHIVGIVPDGNKVNVTVRCLGCKESRTVTVTRGQWDAYTNGAMIQVAFSTLSANDREAIQSGTCPKCWKKMWGGT